MQFLFKNHFLEQEKKEDCFNLSKSLKEVSSIIDSSSRQQVGGGVLQKRKLNLRKCLALSKVSHKL